MIASTTQWDRLRELSMWDETLELEEAAQGSRQSDRSLDWKSFASLFGPVKSDCAPGKFRIVWVSRHRPWLIIFGFFRWRT